MSSSPFRRSLPQRFLLVLTSFLQKSGLAFSDALPEEAIQAAFDAEDVAFAQKEDDVYTPALTLWAFLSQALFKEEQRSCLAAVSRVVALLVGLGRPACSSNTSTYCRARRKLPESVLRRLVYETADGCERVVSDGWPTCQAQSTISPNEQAKPTICRSRRQARPGAQDLAC